MTEAIKHDVDAMFREAVRRGLLKQSDRSVWRVFWEGGIRAPDGERMLRAYQAVSGSPSRGVRPAPVYTADDPAASELDREVRTFAAERDALLVSREQWPGARRSATSGASSSGASD